MKKIIFIFLLIGGFTAVYGQTSTIDSAALATPVTWADLMEILAVRDSVQAARDARQDSLIRLERVQRWTHNKEVEAAFLTALGVPPDSAVVLAKSVLYKGRGGWKNFERYHQAAQSFASRQTEELASKADTGLVRAAFEAARKASQKEVTQLEEGVTSNKEKIASLEREWEAFKRGKGKKFFKK